MHKHNRESGVAAILTVIFFILIISIISLSFLRISVQEGQQTLNDDLSKAAYAAAQSGVNDAKRAMLYCRANPAAAGCATLTNQTCPGFAANASLASTLGLTKQDTGVEVGPSELNERYTCVTITSNTMDVTEDLSPNAGATDQSTTLIPLIGTSAFTTVRVSWHALSTGATPPPSGTYGNGSPRKSQWGGAWPALLRATAYQYPSTGIALDAAGNSNVSQGTFFFYPVQDNALTGGFDPFGAAVSRRNPDQCNAASLGGISTGDPAKKFICQQRFAINSAAGPAYLVLQTHYKPTRVMIELLDASGAVVPFDGVSPLIDSTGAAGNVFRRIQVRARFDGGATPIAPYALDVGGSICKNFRVSANAADFSQNCTP